MSRKGRREKRKMVKKKRQKKPQKYKDSCQLVREAGCLPLPSEGQGGWDEKRERRNIHLFKSHKRNWQKMYFNHGFKAAQKHSTKGEVLVILTSGTHIKE